MAFSHVGNVGTANSKTSNTTLSLSPSSAIEVGQLAVVYLASDSFSDGLGGNNVNRLWKCNDSAGNVWVSLLCRSANSADTGSCSAVFVTLVTTEIGTSDTITATARSAKTAKAMSVEVFDMDAETYVWAIARPSQTDETGAADPPAISTGTIQSTDEHLILHVLAAEGPNTDSYTWDSDYTQITGDGTTGGTDDSNMHVRGGWRIVSGITSDTVDVTSTTADRDYHQGIVCLVETQPRGFPDVDIRDDFNRANETPLDGGLWDTTLRPDSGYLKLASNRAEANHAVSGGSFLDDPITTSTSTCSEAYVTIAALGPGANSICGVAIDCSGNANIDVNQAGRILEWNRAGDSPGASGRSSVDDCLSYCYLGPGGGPHSDGANCRYRIWLDAAVGYRLGLQRINEYVHAYYDVGAGWTWGACYREGGTSSATRRFTLHVFSTAAADDFYAGEIACWQPEFIRRPWRYKGRHLTPNV